MFTIPLWREIDNVTSYFLISSKTLKAVYLSFHGFNDSRTRGFELVTRGFEIGFWILTRAFQLSTRNSQLLTRVLPYYLQQYPFFKKGFRFSENLFKICWKTFKMFKSWSNIYVKTCPSLKQRALLKIPGTIFRRIFNLSIGFKVKPLRKIIFLC